MAHTLVIGGTGMLAGCSRDLIQERGARISLIGRSAPRLHALTQEHAHVWGGVVDYTDLSAFTCALDAAIAHHGPIERTLAWVHAAGSESLPVLAQVTGAEFFHVLGSAACDPSRTPDPQALAWKTKLGGATYHEVILGFEPVGATAARWLTHAEISAGVWEAMQARQPRTVIGVVEPWSRRP